MSGLRSAGNAATLTLGTIVQNEGKQAERAKVKWQILDAAARPWPRPKRRRSRSPPMDRTMFTATAKLANPALWSVDEPNLYSAIVTVEAGGKARDAERVSFGVRTAKFDCRQGLLPEWQDRQDSGHLQSPGPCRCGRGSAGCAAVVPACRAARDGRQRRAHFAQHADARMGGSLRSHGHDDDVRDAADEFQPRGHGATGNDGEALSQFAVDHPVVDRQRRGPAAGCRWPSRARRSRADMVRLCHELDPTRVVSAAVNGDNEQGVSDAFDIIGFNYNLKFPDEYHQKHPEPADLRVGDFKRDWNARRLFLRSAAQYGELL